MSWYMGHFWRAFDARFRETYRCWPPEWVQSGRQFWNIEFLFYCYALQHGDRMRCLKKRMMKITYIHVTYEQTLLRKKIWDKDRHMRGGPLARCLRVWDPWWRETGRTNESLPHFFSGKSDFPLVQRKKGNLDRGFVHLARTKTPPQGECTGARRAWRERVRFFHHETCDCPRVCNVDAPSQWIAHCARNCVSVGKRSPGIKTCLCCQATESIWRHLYAMS